ncbi:uncharacterized protein [Lepeophtheirus salmonis]|uniref:uncharacterized protein n=1 Tax=Lepeophtheirus salmonis TaxID=72036 RepID=UPI003AF3C674
MQVEDPVDDKYHYRLHWWLFIPYSRAKKVAEVLLFSNEGAPGNLHLNFCQWPNDLDKALICGMGSYRDEGESFANCYLTVTTAPSLKACQECVQVASSYEEDEMAEAWNSCVRLSCLQHGMTVHTSFDLLPPHPKFEPKISMKMDGYVIFNTGNILHSLNIGIEPLGPKQNKSSQESPTNTLPSHSMYPKSSMTLSADSTSGSSGNMMTVMAKSSSSLLSMCSKWAELDVGVSEYTFASTLDLDHSSSMQKPFLTHNLTSDSDGDDLTPHHSPPKSFQCGERLERTAEFVNQLNHYSNSSGSLRRTTSNSVRYGPTSRSASWFSEGTFDEEIPCSSSSLCSTSSSSSSIIQSVFTRLDSTSVSPSSNPGCSGVNFNNNNSGGTSERGSLRKKISAAAEKAYEINEHDFESEGIQENLSTFRRKRLADKKYELTDDDFDGSFIQEKLSTFRKKRKNAENLSPPSPSTEASSFQHQSQQQQPIRSPRSHSEDSVLRPLSSNLQTQTEEEEEVLCLSEAELSNMPELLSPGGMVNKKDQSCFSPRESITSSPPLPPCMHFKYTRRYIETDEELTSITTDIEPDEDDTVTPLNRNNRTNENCCHNALSLEVHGSGYQSMTKISNYKAEKFSGKCIKVQQRSLDLECFCFYMAQKLCKAADKNYWFCNDYDVEIVEVNPESGDVICVAVILVLATVVTKKVSPKQTYSISSLHRRQYQGGFKFSWNIDNATCELVDSDPLKEINAFKREPQGAVWHPATSISLSLQKKFGLQEKEVKSMTNECVIGGTSLKTIVDPEHVVAIVLDNLD